MKNGILFIFLLLSPLLKSQTSLIDPKIKSGETLSYNIIVEDKTEKYYVQTNIIEENGIQNYKMISKSDTEDLVMLFQKKDFQIIKIDVNQKENNSIITRNIELKEGRKLKPNEIGLLDFRSLMYVLRAFPFEKEEEFGIHVYASDNSFPMTLKNVGEEILVVDGIEMSCFKLQLKINGFWGKLFPKVNYWYSVSQPHYPVRYEGLSGGPGSAKKVVELVGVAN